MLIRQKIWRCRLLPLFWLYVCVCLCSVKMERIHFNTILKLCHFKDSLVRHPSLSLSIGLSCLGRLSHSTRSHAYTHASSLLRTKIMLIILLLLLLLFLAYFIWRVVGPGQPFSSVIRMFYVIEWVCASVERKEEHAKQNNKWAY